MSSFSYQMRFSSPSQISHVSNFKKIETSSPTPAVVQQATIKKVPQMVMTGSQIQAPYPVEARFDDLHKHNSFMADEIVHLKNALAQKQAESDSWRLRFE